MTGTHKCAPSTVKYEFPRSPVWKTSVDWSRNSDQQHVGSQCSLLHQCDLYRKQRSDSRSDDRECRCTMWSHRVSRSSLSIITQRRILQYGYRRKLPHYEDECTFQSGWGVRSDMVGWVILTLFSTSGHMVTLTLTEETEQARVQQNGI